MGGAPARVDGRLGLLEGPQFPPGLRPRDDPGLQHEHRDRRPRRPRPRLRPAVAARGTVGGEGRRSSSSASTTRSRGCSTAVDVRREVGRRQDGGPARAPLPPDRVGARNDVSRGSPVRCPRPVLPDQGARTTSSGRARRCGRCWRPPCSTERHEAGTKPAHVSSQRSAVASLDGPPRARPAPTLRRLRGAGAGAVRAVPRRPRPHCSARLRALRLPGCVAGPTLRRVHGPPPRVRPCQGRAGLRRACAADRVGLEGARAARPRAGARRPRCRRRRAAGGRRARRRARRSGAGEGARPRAGCASRGGARRPLAAAGRISPRPHGSDEPPAGRPAARGARGERPGRLHSGRPGAGAHCADRRRLHDRGDRVRVRDGASPGRGTSRRGHLPRAGSAVG